VASPKFGLLRLAMDVVAQQRGHSDDITAAVGELPTGAAPHRPCVAANLARVTSRARRLGGPDGDPMYLISAVTRLRTRLQARAWSFTDAGSTTGLRGQRGTRRLRQQRRNGTGGLSGPGEGNRLGADNPGSLMYCKLATLARGSRATCMRGVEIRLASVPQHLRSPTTSRLVPSAF
jgi:hypothetical protein